MEIKTVTQKYEFQNYLDLLKDSLYMQKNNFEQTLKNKIPLPYSDFIKREMEKNRIEATQTEKIKIMLTQMEDNLKQLSEINLTLSFEPDELLINDIYLWIKENIGGGIILNLNINPEIIAGAIISYQGLYTDNSAGKRLKNLSIRQILNKNYE